MKEIGIPVTNWAGSFRNFVNGRALIAALVPVNTTVDGFEQRNDENPTQDLKR